MTPKLKALAFSHVGLAVHSVEEFFDSWGAVLDFEEPMVHDEQAAGGVVVDGIDHGDLEVRVGYTRLGGLPIELIQTTLGETCHQRSIRQRGAGLHHLAFWVDDLPKLVEQAVTSGFSLVMAPATLSRAVLRANPAADAPLSRLVDAGRAQVPEFFSFFELPTAQTQWTLELLDSAYVSQYRELNGDLPGYPPADAPERTGA